MKKAFKCLIPLSMVILFAIFFYSNSNILRSDSKAYFLKYRTKFKLDKGYIEIISFSLENDIVQISLRSNLGNVEDWKDTVKLIISDRKYPIHTNAEVEVSDNEKINTISCIGEIGDMDTITDQDTIILGTPFKDISIEYITKNKFYY